MKDTLLAWLEESGPFAFLISLLANTAISLLAFVPSVFVTAANLSFFGLINGLILSFSGEVIGVMVSFYVYRKGFRFLSRKTSVHSSSVLKKLSGITEKDAFFVILSLRIFPFVPSGAITLAAACSSVSAGTFLAASFLGKVPAILIEGFAVHQVLNAEWRVQLFLVICSLLILAGIWMKKRILD